MKPYKELFLEQSTPEWLLVRKNHVTATDVSKITSNSPWSSPLECYLEKVEGKTTPLNAAMKRGQDLEVKARAFLEKRDGAKLEPKCFESVDHPFLMASLDATDRNCTKGYEIKCPQEKAMTRALEGKYDKYYNFQLQAQMFVMGWDSIELFYYHNDFINASFIVKRDDELIKSFIAVVKLFWEHNVLAEVPPPSGKKKLKEVDDYKTNELALQWRDAIEIEKEAIRTRKAIEEDLKEILGDSECLMINAGVSRTIINKKGVIDNVKIYEKYDLSENTLESYRKKGSSYSKFTIVN